MMQDMLPAIAKGGTGKFSLADEQPVVRTDLRIYAERLQRAQNLREDFGLPVRIARQDEGIVQVSLIVKDRPASGDSAGHGNAFGTHPARRTFPPRHLIFPDHHARIVCVEKKQRRDFIAAIQQHILQREVEMRIVTFGSEKAHDHTIGDCDVDATNFFGHEAAMKTFLLLASIALAATATFAADEVVIDNNSFDGWQKSAGWLTASSVSLNKTNEHFFVIETGKGLIVNGPTGRAVELLTKQEFDDCEVHVEFCVTKKSNSGVFLMGRYEVQVYDSFGVAKDAYPGIECGGIYPRWANKNFEGHSPRVNASKPAGEWQSFDITFRAPRFDASGKKTENAKFIKVVHNGTVVHENVEVSGPTRATISETEIARGPLRLQGDHGPVAYRNIRIKPL